LQIFGWYRIALAIIVIIFQLIKWYSIRVLTI
jgi:hypothetical protein